jgi:hypothetical protein
MLRTSCGEKESDFETAGAIFSREEDAGKRRPSEASLKIAYRAVALDSSVGRQNGNWLIFQRIRRRK